MKITEEQHKLLLQTLTAMKATRQPFWQLWRDLADYYLPKRYVWLLSDNEAKQRTSRNPFLLDSTGTVAARILASGMMNGITSPTRPWFYLRVPGYDDDGGPITQWCDEVTRRMMRVFAESNFYNAMAVTYLDLVIFGSAAQLIYEDHKTVIRCFNPALGEFYFAQDERLVVNSFGREFTQTVFQCVQRWGKENCSERVREAWNAGGARRLELVKIAHLIEPNADEKFPVPKMFEYRETYWEIGQTKGDVLYCGGFHELPGIFPRWECTANDDYGTSPALDALPDVMQLQQETKRKGQGLDKMVSPPIIADIQLQHRPTALLPNGVTYIAGLANNPGAKPLYQITPPIGEMTEDIRDIRTRIQEIFHNPLFNMISQLDTVRSATEIDARKEEKLVLLGSVLERFENEALDPAITRTFNIMNRANMLPDPPEEIAGLPLEIQYVSILAVAQKAAAAAPTERWLGLIGNISPVAPQVLNVPKWDEIVRNYGIAIGVAARDMNTMEEVEQLQQQKDDEDAAAKAAALATNAVDAGKQLSETQVGGGVNALQTLMGG